MCPQERSFGVVPQALRTCLWSSKERGLATPPVLFPNFGQEWSWQMLMDHCIHFFPLMPCLVPHIRGMTQPPEAAWPSRKQVPGGALSKDSCRRARLPNILVLLKEVSLIFHIFFVKLLTFPTYLQLGVSNLKYYLCLPVGL